LAVSTLSLAAASRIVANVFWIESGNGTPASPDMQIEIQPATKSGRLSANSSIWCAPIEWPMTTTLSSRSSSHKRAASSQCR
jgi:hypothetical protein